MRKLFHVPLSGHSHRALLFLSLLDLDHEIVEIDFMNGEHKQDAHLARNAFGEVPVLEEDGRAIADSNAILVYLARRYGADHWLPADPWVEAEVQRWLSVAAGRIAFGPCAARLNTLFGASFDTGEVVARAKDTLRVMDARLADADWIAATPEPTIADVALYSYVDRAPEGGIDLAPYQHVRTWLQRIEALPGFVAMPRSAVGLETRQD